VRSVWGKAASRANFVEINAGGSVRGGDGTGKLYLLLSKSTSSGIDPNLPHFAIAPSDAYLFTLASTGGAYYNPERRFREHLIVVKLSFS
jgi:hypothetical protein